MGYEILSVLHDAWVNFLGLLTRFLPRLLAMLLIVLAGWLVAQLVRVTIRRTLRLLHFEVLLERSGAADLLRRAEAPPIEQLLATIAFWLVLLTFLLSGLHALGFTGTELLFTDLVRFVPRLVTAGAVLVVGVALSNFLWRAALLGAVNARLPSARLLGALARTLALAATVAMALEELNVGWQVVQSVFVLSFGAVMLAAGIAFGLGGRHLARRFLEDRLRPGDGHKEEPPHI